jgi:hypothetical protein
MAKIVFVMILLAFVLAESGTAQQQQQQSDPTEALRTMLKAQVRGRHLTFFSSGCLKMCEASAL